MAEPVKAYPSIFLPGSIWDRYPYLLPNLFSAVSVFMGVIVGVLFLEETHEDKKHTRDRGVELGNRILAFFERKESSPRQGKGLEEEHLLDTEEQLPGYDTALQLGSTNDPAIQRPLDLVNPVITRVAAPERPSPATIFTRPVVLIIISYGILAL